MHPDIHTDMHTHTHHSRKAATSIIIANKHKTRNAAATAA